MIKDLLYIAWFYLYLSNLVISSEQINNVFDDKLSVYSHGSTFRRVLEKKLILCEDEEEPATAVFSSKVYNSHLNLK